MILNPCRPMRQKYKRLKVYKVEFAEILNYSTLRVNSVNTELIFASSYIGKKKLRHYLVDIGPI